MENTTHIVLFKLNNNYNARKHCEILEDMTFDLNEDTIDGHIYKAIDYYSNDFEVWNISDFMEACNDQEIQIDAYFLTYINIIK